MPVQKKKNQRSHASRHHVARHKELIDEMQDLHDAIDELRTEVKKLAPPTAIIKAFRGFFTGIVRGVGFVVGTTLVAAVLIYFVQQSFESGRLQNWVSDQIRGAITESIDEYTPSFLQRDSD